MDKNPNIFKRIVNREKDISFEKEIDPCNTPIGSSRYLNTNSCTNFNANFSTNFGTSDADSDEYFKNPGSILSLQPWLFKRDKQNPNSNPNHNLSEKPETSTAYKTSIRTRRGHKNSIKPISLENCLIPQLYNEDFKFEEHVFGSVKTRPFIITDGIRVISKNLENEICSNKDCEIFENKDGLKKGKRKSLDENGNLRSSKHSNSQAHSPSYPARESTNNKNKTNNNNNNNNNNNTFILSIGICIGVLSSILKNKKELEKLNDKLKLSENLVQDLQEELEMKDSLTVQELSNIEENQEEPSRSFLNGEDNNRESMSKIEAELEAELEMLEINVTSNNINARVSNFDDNEVDGDLVGEIVKGELKAETLKKRDNYDDYDDINNDDADIINTDHWTGPVSPRQLSIRLHELIQERNEERIKELEIKLEQSQRQVLLLENSEVSVFSERTLSNSDLDSGPLINNNDEDNDNNNNNENNNEVFCLNLSGEALSAYKEAFEEFDKEDLNLNLNLKEGENEKVYWELGNEDDNNDYDINEFNFDDNDDDDCDEILKKIMEKTKQGSPVIRHAQMMLLSLDERNL